MGEKTEKRYYLNTIISENMDAQDSNTIYNEIERLKYKTISILIIYN